MIQSIEGLSRQTDKRNRQRQHSDLDPLRRRYSSAGTIPNYLRCSHLAHICRISSASNGHSHCFFLVLLLLLPPVLVLTPDTPPSSQASSFSPKMSVLSLLPPFDSSSSSLLASELSLFSSDATKSRVCGNIASVLLNCRSLYNKDGAGRGGDTYIYILSIYLSGFGGRGVMILAQIPSAGFSEGILLSNKRIGAKKWR